MRQEKTRIRYTSLFSEDLDDTAYYIANNLKNPDAAERFLRKIENAVEERSHNPCIGAVYAESLENGLPYYRIIVGNFIVFYVVLIDEDEIVMEVRRVLYGRRNISLLIFDGDV